MLVSTDTRSNNIVLTNGNLAECNLIYKLDESPECDLVYILTIEHYLERGWSREFSHFLANLNAEDCEESMND